jgi:dihydroorotate dehydrogenase
VTNHRLYSFLFTAFLKRLDPEDAHHLGAMLVKASGLPIIRSIKHEFLKPSRRLEVKTLGMNFASPFGMAAGFDKNADMIAGLYAMGFGHVEVGTLTAVPQPGNPRPRLFRLVADRALINRMGFNNHGAAAAVAKIARVRRHKNRPIIGVNIGKSRVVEVENAIDDYLTSARLLAPVADYLVINVSSPNTPGLRGLQELDQLEPLLTAVKKASGATPLLVKIAPDLTDDQVTRIANLAVACGLDGIIATNTTLSRENLQTPPDVVEHMGAGGLSGPPLASRSLEILKIIRRAVPSDFCVISVGGVDSAADVHERLSAGATLVQGYTAFIYRGPFWASRINKSLRQLGYGSA